MTIVVALWLLAGGGLALSFSHLAERIWILTEVPVFLWGAVGLAIAAFSLYRLFERAHRRRALRHGLAVLLGLLLFDPTVILGARLAQQLRFRRHRAHYERLIAAAERGALQDDGIEGGVRYQIDPGPPVRMAFLLPGGVLDNWCGIVHDPTADVLAINEATLGAEDWYASSVRGLFGGDMTSCRPMDPPFYLCCFT